MPAAVLFFIFSCTLYFTRIWFFVLIVLHFAFSYNTKHKQPHAGGNFFSLCTSSVMLLCPDFPGFAFLSLLCNTHNTNIHTAGGIRTRNHRKRLAAGVALHRATTGIGRFDPRTVHPISSRCTDNATLAHFKNKSTMKINLFLS